MNHEATKGTKGSQEATLGRGPNNKIKNEITEQTEITEHTEEVANQPKSKPATLRQD